MKKIFLLLSVAMGFISISFKVMNDQPKKPWPVPAKFTSMQNPIPADKASLSTGKSLWSTHCKSCHGTKGVGDGSKAAQLKTEPGDLTSAEVQQQSDGALFYKVQEGRDDMPNFKKKIPDEDDIWSVVNYMRTLK